MVTDRCVRGQTAKRLYLLRQLDEFQVELLGGSQTTDVAVERFQTLDVVGFGQNALQSAQSFLAQLDQSDTSCPQHSVVVGGVVEHGGGLGARLGTAQTSHQLSGRHAELT